MRPYFLLFVGMFACSSIACSSVATPEIGSDAPGSTDDDAGSSSDGTHDAAAGSDDAQGSSLDGGAHADAAKLDGSIHDGSTVPPDASTPDDPRLDDPSRASFPYECQGTPLSAADLTEHFAQGTDEILISNGRNWNNSASVLRVDQVARNCNPVTGCSTWTNQSAGIGLYRREFRLDLFVSAGGAVALHQEMYAAAPLTIGTIATADFQGVMGGVNDGVDALADAERYKVRAVRRADMSGCFSVAGVVHLNPTAADGSHSEYFYLGVATFASRATIPRIVQPTLAPWPSQCAGTAAEDATIATWFTSGATTKNFPVNGNARRASTQDCHPITGCTPWVAEVAPSDELFGLQTTATGFALRFDYSIAIPISHGHASGTHPTYGAVAGLVTTTGCVSYDAHEIVSYVGSGVVTEKHFEEANHAK